MDRGLTGGRNRTSTKTTRLQASPPPSHSTQWNQPEDTGDIHPMRRQQYELSLARQSLPSPTPCMERLRAMGSILR